MTATLTLTKGSNQKITLTADGELAVLTNGDHSLTMTWREAHKAFSKLLQTGWVRDY